LLAPLTDPTPLALCRLGLLLRSFRQERSLPPPSGMTTVATGQVLLAGSSPAGLAASFAAPSGLPVIQALSLITAAARHARNEGLHFALRRLQTECKLGCDQRWRQSAAILRRRSAAAAPSKTGKERHRRSGRSLGFGTRCLNEIEASMLLALANLADILQDFVRSG
jgi:hypothetical protein